MGITGFRDRIKALSPAFLQAGVSERLMYVYGLGVDAVAEKLFQGVQARFPTMAPSSAQDEIGRDRLILRGLTEADESYGARLQRSLGDHQHDGSSRAVLSQLLGFLLALTPAVRFVSSRYDRSGGYPATRLDTSWDSYPAGRSPSAEPVHTYVTAAAGNFDWDSLTEVLGSWSWWGSFVIVEAVTPNDWIHVDGAWGSGGVWGDGGAWGVDASPNVALSMLGIVKQFKGAHTWVRSLIVSFDSSLFDPSQPAGGGVNPDGKFGRWSKSVGGQRLPARFANARYGDGVI